MEQAMKNEFEFYSKFAKPFILNLSKTEERLKAAAWVKKLSDETLGIDELRTDYLKLLLFSLQRNKLVGIFSDDPDTYKTLENFPMGLGISDIAKALLDDELKSRQEKITKQMQGDMGEIPPFTTDCSADMKEYAAAQDIPNFGVHAYYAISREPLNLWQHSERILFPKGTKHPPFQEPPASGSTISAPCVTCSAKKAEAKDETPTDTGAASAEEPPPPCMQRAPQRKKRSKKLGKTPPVSPIGVVEEPEERQPPTWGTNLVQVVEPLDPPRSSREKSSEEHKTPPIARSSPRPSPKADDSGMDESPEDEAYDMEEEDRQEDKSGPCGPRAPCAKSPPNRMPEVTQLFEAAVALAEAGPEGLADADLSAFGIDEDIGILEEDLPEFDEGQLDVSMDINVHDLREYLAKYKKEAARRSRPSAIPAPGTAAGKPGGPKTSGSEIPRTGGSGLPRASGPTQSQSGLPRSGRSGLPRPGASTGMARPVVAAGSQLPRVGVSRIPAPGSQLPQPSSRTPGVQATAVEPSQQQQFLPSPDEMLEQSYRENVEALEKTMREEAVTEMKTDLGERAFKELAKTEEDAAEALHISVHEAGVEEDHPVVSKYQDIKMFSKNEDEITRLGHTFRDTTPALANQLPITTPRPSGCPRRPNKPERLFQEPGDDFTEIKEFDFQNTEEGLSPEEIKAEEERQAAVARKKALEAQLLAQPIVRRGSPEARELARQAVLEISRGQERSEEAASEPISEQEMGAPQGYPYGGAPCTPPSQLPYGRPEGFTSPMYTPPQQRPYGRPEGFTSPMYTPPPQAPCARPAGFTSPMYTPPPQMPYGRPEGYYTPMQTPPQQAPYPRPEEFYTPPCTPLPQQPYGRPEDFVSPDRQFDELGLLDMGAMQTDILEMDDLGQGGEFNLEDSFGEYPCGDVGGIGQEFFDEGFLASPPPVEHEELHMLSPSGRTPPKTFEEEIGYVPHVSPKFQSGSPPPAQSPRTPRAASPPLRGPSPGGPCGPAAPCSDAFPPDSPGFLDMGGQDMDFGYAEATADQLFQEMDVRRRQLEDNAAAAEFEGPCGEAAPCSPKRLPRAAPAMAPCAQQEIPPQVPPQMPPETVKREKKGTKGPAKKPSGVQLKKTKSQRLREEKVQEQKKQQQKQAEEEAKRKEELRKRAQAKQAARAKKEPPKQAPKKTKKPGGPCGPAAPCSEPQVPPEALAQMPRAQPPRPKPSGLRPPSGAPCAGGAQSSIRPPGTGIRPPGVGIRPPRTGIRPPGGAPCAVPSGIEQPGMGGIPLPGTGFRSPGAGPCGPAAPCSEPAQPPSPPSPEYEEPELEPEFQELKKELRQVPIYAGSFKTERRPFHEIMPQIAQDRLDRSMCRTGEQLSRHRLFDPELGVMPIMESPEMRPPPPRPRSELHSKKVIQKIRSRVCQPGTKPRGPGREEQLQAALTETQRRRKEEVEDWRRVQPFLPEDPYAMDPARYQARVEHGVRTLELMRTQKRPEVAEEGYISLPFTPPRIARHRVLEEAVPDYEGEQQYQPIEDASFIGEGPCDVCPPAPADFRGAIRRTDEPGPYYEEGRHKKHRDKRRRRKKRERDIFGSPITDDEEADYVRRLEREEEDRKYKKSRRETQKAKETDMAREILEKQRELLQSLEAKRRADQGGMEYDDEEEGAWGGPRPGEEDICGPGAPCASGGGAAEAAIDEELMRVLQAVQMSPDRQVQQKGAEVQEQLESLREEAAEADIAAETSQELVDLPANLYTQEERQNQERVKVTRKQLDLRARVKRAGEELSFWLGDAFGEPEPEDEPQPWQQRMEPQVTPEAREFASPPRPTMAIERYGRTMTAGPFQPTERVPQEWTTSEGPCGPQAPCAEAAGEGAEEEGAGLWDIQAEDVLALSPTAGGFREEVMMMGKREWELRRKMPALRQRNIQQPQFPTIREGPMSPPPCRPGYSPYSLLAGQGPGESPETPQSQIIRRDDGTCRGSSSRRQEGWDAIEAAEYEVPQDYGETSLEGGGGPCYPHTPPLKIPRRLFPEDAPVDEQLDFLPLSPCGGQQALEEEIPPLEEFMDEDVDVNQLLMSPDQQWFDDQAEVGTCGPEAPCTDDSDLFGSPMAAVPEYLSPMEEPAPRPTAGGMEDFDQVFQWEQAERAREERNWDRRRRQQQQEQQRMLAQPDLIEQRNRPIYEDQMRRIQQDFPVPTGEIKDIPPGFIDRLKKHKLPKDYLNTAFRAESSRYVRSYSGRPIPLGQRAPCAGAISRQMYHPDFGPIMEGQAREYEPAIPPHLLPPKAKRPKSKPGQQPLGRGGKASAARQVPASRTGSSGAIGGAPCRPGGRPGGAPARPGSRGKRGAPPEPAPPPPPAEIPKVMSLRQPIPLAERGLKKGPKVMQRIRKEMKGEFIRPDRVDSEAGLRQALLERQERWRQVATCGGYQPPVHPFDGQKQFDAYTSLAAYRRPGVAEAGILDMPRTYQPRAPASVRKLLKQSAEAPPLRGYGKATGMPCGEAAPSAKPTRGIPQQRPARPAASQQSVASRISSRTASGTSQRSATSQTNIRGQRTSCGGARPAAAAGPSQMRPSIAQVSPRPPPRPRPPPQARTAPSQPAAPCAQAAAQLAPPAAAAPCAKAASPLSAVAHISPPAALNFRTPSPLQTAAFTAASKGGSPAPCAQPAFTGSFAPPTAAFTGSFDPPSAAPCAQPAATFTGTFAPPAMPYVPPAAPRQLAAGGGCPGAGASRAQSNLMDNSPSGHRLVRKTSSRKMMVKRLGKRR